MLALTRKLAEIGLTRAGPERDLAIHDWDILAKSLDADPDFGKLFRENAAAIDKIRRAAHTPADLERVKRNALIAARDLKAQSAKLNDAVLTEQLKNRRRLSYDSAEFCANEIVTTLEQLPFTEVEPLTKEFWILYWGELGLFEGAAVQTAMMNFGEQLKTIDRTMSAKLAPDLNAVLKSIGKDEIKSEHISQQINQLRSDVALDERLRLNVARASKEKADKEQVKVLRGLLTKLERALHSERDSDLAGNAPVPTTY
jgi:hypothetical protein